MALDKIAIISIFVESAVWGLSVPLFAITLFLLLRKPSEQVKRIPHVIILITLLILGFVHLVINFLRDLNALRHEESHPDAQLRIISDTLYRAKYGVLFAVLFIGDMVIASRCFVVWNRNYFAGALPVILAVATLVCAGGTLRSLVNVANTGITFEELVQKWFIATYALALITKLVCTALVVWRVRQIYSEITKNVNRHVNIYTTLFVVVNSGCLACLITLILVPLAVTDIDQHVLFCDVLCPITSITVMLIMIASTLDLTKNQSPSPAIVRQSIVAPGRPTISTLANPATTNRWDDFEDMKGSPGTPTYGSTADYLDTNKSSGTLNMAIVI